MNPFNGDFVSLLQGGTKTAQPAGRQGVPHHHHQALTALVFEERVLKSAFLTGTKQTRESVGWFFQPEFQQEIGNAPRLSLSARVA